MPWNPGIVDRSGEIYAQGISHGAGVLSEDLLQALKKYEDRQKEKAFGDTVMEHLAQTPGPDGKPYVPIDALNRYHSAGATQQAGMVQGALANVTHDSSAAQQQRQQQLADAQIHSANAEANWREAQAYNEWTGQGNDAPLNLTPEEQAAGANIGKVPLRTSGKSFQWADDPNNPANMGAAPRIPVYDPNGSGKVVATTAADGSGYHALPKPTQIQELIDAGMIKPPPGFTPANPPAGPAAPATGTPTVGEVRRGYRFKGGNPADPNAWEKVPQ